MAYCVLFVLLSAASLKSIATSYICVCGASCLTDAGGNKENHVYSGILSFLSSPVVSSPMVDLVRFAGFALGLICHGGGGASPLKLPADESDHYLPQLEGRTKVDIRLSHVSALMPQTAERFGTCAGFSILVRTQS